MITTTSMFCFIFGVNNPHIFLTASINTFPENINCYKAVKGFSNLFQQAVSVRFDFVQSFLKISIPKDIQR